MNVGYRAGSSEMEAQREKRMHWIVVSNKDRTEEWRSSSESVALCFLLCRSIMSPFQGAHKTPQNWDMAKTLVYLLTERENVW